MVSRPKALDEVALPETLPPLVITAFARPDLLAPILQTIQQQTLLPPQLIAFVDGPRKARDEPLIQACINLLEDCARSIPIEIVARSQNLGCDRNVILGFTEVFTTHEALVYLEDDDLPNACFYDRMCRLLAVYRDCPQIASVSSYATLPTELDPKTIEADFFVSRRFFSWGFGTWRDRWQQLDLMHVSGQYNPFEQFYNIPATMQTQRTIINQFWLEKNRKTDWVITFTIASLYHQKVHIIPKTSFVENIGFGHAQSETYRGAEQAWVNAHYDADFIPNRLPAQFDLLPPLASPLSTCALIQSLTEQRGLWLNLSACIGLLRTADSWLGWLRVVQLFVIRLPILFQRWRSGLPL
ncbi:MAG: sugar transferase [Spirulina sp. SIO3F2]|nr:sugar transferase [Spirulina sp. SIO3F2]